MGASQAPSRAQEAAVRSGHHHGSHLRFDLPWCPLPFGLDIGDRRPLLPRRLLHGHSRGQQRTGGKEPELSMESLSKDEGMLAMKHFDSATSGMRVRLPKSTTPCIAKLLFLVLLTLGLAGCNGGRGGFAPIHKVGPREAQLNSRIAEQEEGNGRLGQAVAADPDVRRAIDRARSICRRGDDYFGNQANIQTETQVEQATADMYVAMDLALRQIAGGVARSATPSSAPESSAGYVSPPAVTSAVAPTGQPINAAQEASTAQVTVQRPAPDRLPAVRQTVYKCDCGAQVARSSDQASPARSEQGGCSAWGSEGHEWIPY
jgi:hypothetical protein